MAQTYKFGNGTWATKKGSTLAYSDTNNAFKPLPFNFTRNSIATRVNKEGLIEVVGNDIPRIDYTDSTEGALLLENSSTNLITYSEDFSNSTWAKLDTTITSNEILSPIGLIDVSKLTDNNNNARHGLLIPFIWASGIQSVCSVYAKKGTSSKLVIGSTSNAQGSFFDLETETIVNTGSFVGSMVSVGNGWYRCSTVFTAPSNYNLIIGMYSVAGNLYYTGVGSDIYIFGAQLEVGSYATSYIPTNGSTVQRAAETCNGSGNSEVFNDSQGVLFANIAALSDDGTFRNISINNDTTAQAIRIYYRNIDYKLTVLIASSSSASVTLDVPKSTQFLKIAIKYILNNVEIYVNGFLVNTISSVAMPIGLNQLDFDIDNQLRFYGKTKEIGYYDTILTDAELETLTSYRSLNEMVTELNLNAL